MAGPNPLLASALACAARGWKVLPVWWPVGDQCACGSATCIAPAKHPTYARGFFEHGLAGASSDDATIARWWERWPEASPALALAASGLVALDLDLYKGDRDKLAALVAQLGPLPERTLAQRSGSQQGAHLIFRAPPHPVRGQLGGITVRGRNYVVLAPSLHKSGGRYAWLPGCGPEERDAADLPAAWAEALQPDEALSDAGVPPEAEEPDWLREVPRDERVRLARLHVDGEKGEERGVSRPGMMYDVCRSVARGYALRDPRDAAALIEAFSDKCRPPYPRGEWLRRLESAYVEAHTPEWGSLIRENQPLVIPGIDDIAAPLLLAAREPDTDPFAFLDEAVEGAAALVTEQGEKESRYIELLREAKLAVVPRLAATPDASAERRSRMFEPAAVVVSRDYPKKPWLVRGIVPARGVGMLSTEPKSGKTWAEVEIALAAATGTPAFGEFFVEEAAHVCVLFLEDDGPSVRNKIRSLCAERGIDPMTSLGRLHLQPRGRAFDLTLIEDVCVIVASCWDVGRGEKGMLWIDPFRDAHSAEEDTSDGMAPVMRALRVIADLTGWAVGVVHHSGKISGDQGKRRLGQRMRGSSAIHGAIDWGIYFCDLQVSEDGRTFTNTVESEVKGARGGGRFAVKLTIEDDNHGEAVRAAWEYSRESEEKRQEAQDADDERRIVDYLRVVFRAVKSEITRNVKGNNGRVASAVDRMLASGALAAIGSGRYPMLQLADAGNAG